MNEQISIQILTPAVKETKGPRWFALFYYADNEFHEETHYEFLLCPDCGYPQPWPWDDKDLKPCPNMPHKYTLPKQERRQYARNVLAEWFSNGADDA